MQNPVEDLDLDDPGLASLVRTEHPLRATPKPKPKAKEQVGFDSFSMTAVGGWVGERPVPVFWGIGPITSGSKGHGRLRGFGSEVKSALRAWGVPRPEGALPAGLDGHPATMVFPGIGPVPVKGKGKDRELSPSSVRRMGKGKGSKDSSKGKDAIKGGAPVWWNRMQTITGAQLFPKCST